DLLAGHPELLGQGVHPHLVRELRCLGRSGVRLLRRLICHVSLLTPPGASPPAVGSRRSTLTRPHGSGMSASAHAGRRGLVVSRRADEHATSAGRSYRTDPPSSSGSTGSGIRPESALPSRARDDPVDPRYVDRSPLDHSGGDTTEYPTDRARCGHQTNVPGPEKGPAHHDPPGQERAGNQMPISRAADSGESEPCTRFSWVTVPRSPRIEPGAALSTGSVPPASCRKAGIARGPSTTSATSGAEVMKEIRSG